MHMHPVGLGRNRRAAFSLLALVVVLIASVTRASPSPCALLIGGGRLQGHHEFDSCVVSGTDSEILVDSDDLASFLDVTIRNASWTGGSLVIRGTRGAVSNVRLRVEGSRFSMSSAGIVINSSTTVSNVSLQISNASTVIVSNGSAVSIIGSYTSVVAASIDIADSSVTCEGSSRVSCGSIAMLSGGTVTHVRSVTISVANSTVAATAQGVVACAASILAQRDIIAATLTVDEALIRIIGSNVSAVSGSNQWAVSSSITGLGTVSVANATVHVAQRSTITSRSASHGAFAVCLYSSNGALSLRNLAIRLTAGSRSQAESGAATACSVGILANSGLLSGSAVVVAVSESIASAHANQSYAVAAGQLSMQSAQVTSQATFICASSQVSAVAQGDAAVALGWLSFNGALSSESATTDVSANSQVSVSAGASLAVAAGWLSSTGILSCNSSAARLSDSSMNVSAATNSVVALGWVSTHRSASTRNISASSTTSRISAKCGGDIAVVLGWMTYNGTLRVDDADAASVGSDIVVSVVRAYAAALSWIVRGDAALRNVTATASRSWITSSSGAQLAYIMSGLAYFGSLDAESIQLRSASSALQTSAPEGLSSVFVLGSADPSASASITTAVRGATFRACDSVIATRSSAFAVSARSNRLAVFPHSYTMTLPISVDAMSFAISNTTISTTAPTPEGECLTAPSNDLHSVSVLRNVSLMCTGKIGNMTSSSSTFASGVVNGSSGADILGLTFPGANRVRFLSMAPASCPSFLVDPVADLQSESCDLLRTGGLIRGRHLFDGCILSISTSVTFVGVSFPPLVVVIRNTNWTGGSLFVNGQTATELANVTIAIESSNFTSLRWFLPFQSAARYESVSVSFLRVSGLEIERALCRFSGTFVEATNISLTATHSVFRVGTVTRQSNVVALGFLTDSSQSVVNMSRITVRLTNTSAIVRGADNVVCAGVAMPVSDSVGTLLLADVHLELSSGTNVALSAALVSSIVGVASRFNGGAVISAVRTTFAVRDSCFVNSTVTSGTTAVAGFIASANKKEANVSLTISNALMIVTTSTLLVDVNGSMASTLSFFAYAGSEDSVNIVNISVSNSRVKFRDSYVTTTTRSRHAAVGSLFAYSFGEANIDAHNFSTVAEGSRVDSSSISNSVLLCVMSRGVTAATLQATSTRILSSSSSLRATIDGAHVVGFQAHGFRAFTVVRLFLNDVIIGVCDSSLFTEEMALDVMAWNSIVGARALIGITLNSTRFLVRNSTVVTLQAAPYGNCLSGVTNASMSGGAEFPSVVRNVSLRCGGVTGSPGFDASSVPHRSLYASNVAGATGEQITLIAFPGASTSLFTDSFPPETTRDAPGGIPPTCGSFFADPIGNPFIVTRTPTPTVSRTRSVSHSTSASNSLSAGTETVSFATATLSQPTASPTAPTQSSTPSAASTRSATLIATVSETSSPRPSATSSQSHTAEETISETLSPAASVTDSMTTFCVVSFTLRVSPAALLMHEFRDVHRGAVNVTVTLEQDTSIEAAHRMDFTDSAKWNAFDRERVLQGINITWGAVDHVETRPPSTLLVRVTTGSQLKTADLPIFSLTVASIQLPVRDTPLFACSNVLRWGDDVNETERHSFSIEFRPSASPVPRPVRRTAEYVAMSSTFVSSALTNPTTAMTMARSSALMTLSICQFSHTEPLDPMDSPFQFTVGHARGSYYRGAMVGWIFLLIVCMVFGGAATLLFYDPRRPADRNLWSALGIVHLPGLLILPVSQFFQSQSMVATALIGHGTGSIDVGLGVAMHLLLVTIVACVVWRTTIGFHAVVVPREEAFDPNNNVVEKALYHLFLSTQKWVDDPTRLHVSRGFKAHWFNIYNDYRRGMQWYLGMELVISILVGALNGIMLEDACDTIAVLFLLLIGAQCLMAIGFRPFIALFENIVYIMLSTLTFLSSLLLVIGELRDDATALEAAAYVALIAVVISSLKSLADLGAILRWFHSRWRRRQKKHRERRRLLNLGLAKRVADEETDEDSAAFRIFVAAVRVARQRCRCCTDTRGGEESASDDGDNQHDALLEDAPLLEITDKKDASAVPTPPSSISTSAPSEPLDVAVQPERRHKAQPRSANAKPRRLRDLTDSERQQLSALQEASEALARRNSAAVLQLEQLVSETALLGQTMGGTSSGSSGGGSANGPPPRQRLFDQNKALAVLVLDICLRQKRKHLTML